MNVCLNVSFDLFVLSHVSECFNSFSPGGRCTHLHVRPTCTAGPMRIKIPSSSLIPVGSSLRVKSIHQTHPRFHKIIIIITVFTYAAKVDTNNYLKPFIHVCTLLNEQTKEVHRRDDRDICADLWEAVYNLLGVEAKRTPQLFKSVGQQAQMAGKQLVIAEFPLVGRP